MIKKILRDNVFINPILRVVIKAIHCSIIPLGKLPSLYRIYGVVHMSIDKICFKIYSKADDHIANEIFYNHGYEAQEFQLIKTLTKRSKYFIDVGANTGIFSIYAARANKKLDVLSFEPHPKNFERLLMNISINNLSNVKAFRNALGSSNTELEFTIPSDLSISTTASINAEYSKNFHPIAYKNIVVKQRRVDDVLADLPIKFFDVIKVDVEYYELEVLKGAKSTLLHKRPLLIIELLQYENLVQQYPKMKDKLNEHHSHEVFHFLNQLGYHAYAIEDNGVVYLDTLKGQHNRNFLFVPFKLSQASYTINEIEKALSTNIPV